MAAEDDHCEKNDNHSVIAHPIWMMNTLLDIDCLAQYEPFCQLVVAAIAVGTMNWKSVIDVANWWM